MPFINHPPDVAMILNAWRRAKFRAEEDGTHQLTVT
jgi:hypothetical protein